MSDSDDDIMQDVFSFQNGNTIMWGRGPKSTTNLTGPSFRNNILTSTMQMPNNFTRSRFMEPDFDQRTVCSRRDISPKSCIDNRSNYKRWETSSIYGGGDVRTHNFHSRDSVRTMTSRRFDVNTRRGSPFPVRSIGESFRNNILTSTMQMRTNYDRPRIAEPNFDQQCVHPRRDISPISSIDSRSNYNRWETSYMYGGGDARPHNFRDTARIPSSQRSVVNGRCGSPFSVRSTASKTSESARSIAMAIRNMEFDKDDLRLIKDAISMYIDNTPPVNNLHNAPKQKQRFENRFLIPSHKLNKSSAIIPIQKANEFAQHYTEVRRKGIDTSEQRNYRQVTDTESEEDEIFSEITCREKTMHSHKPERKRCLNNEDNIYLPDNKRHKLSSPAKTNDRIKKTMPKQTNNNLNNKENDKQANHFEFVKPSLPKKQSIKAKKTIISKSAQPILDTDQYVQNSAQGQTLQPMHENPVNTLDEPSQVNSTNDSMRPSFIKRKLFTQKLDVTEKHNTSGVNSSINSPQANIYSATQNEKHKARKLVTSQSYLSRDVREGNNLLDLIHKIVPSAQMNVTNQINKTDTTHKDKSEDSADKWDVTSVIITCNSDNVSDTYTETDSIDEDMIKNNTNDVPNKQSKSARNKMIETVVRNPNTEKKTDVQTLKELERIQTFETENVAKKHTKNYVKSFWDSDSESDVESTTVPMNLNHMKEHQRTRNLGYKEMTKNQANNKLDTRNNTKINNNLPAPYSYKTLNNTHKILSHHSPKKKKSNEEPVKRADSKFFGPQNKCSQLSKKNRSVSKKETSLINTKTKSTKNDISQIVNIKTNRLVRTCRLNESHKETCVSQNSNRILQITLTPLKIDKKIRDNVKNTNEVKVRKSDVSFSLPSKKYNPGKKNSVRNKNNSNKSVDKNYSMVLRSNSTLSPYNKVVTRNQVKSKPNTKKTK